MFDMPRRMMLVIALVGVAAGRSASADAVAPAADATKLVASDCGEVGLRYDWAIYFDAANDEQYIGETVTPGSDRVLNAQPQAVASPPQLVVVVTAKLRHEKLENFVIQPNTFGVLVVRHFAANGVSFSNTGTVALSSPAITSPFGGTVLALDARTPMTNSPLSPDEKKQIRCSFQPVAPRTPGPFTVKVQILSRDDHSKVVSERTLDLLVEQRYAGAFRVGIAAIAFAPDQKFAAETFPNSGQAEIVRTAKTPMELVIGYSLFLDGFNEGRRYGKLADDDCFFTHHVGLFLGFGALSMSSGNFDFLKSVHAGLEFEFSPNLSIAVTGVVRRVDELADGLHVGAPAPMPGVPLQSSYVAGAAIVLNINPAFFRFALQLGK